MVMSGSVSEWTAEPMRVVARWVRVRDAEGRPCLEMRWAPPSLEVPRTPSRATGTTTAA